MIADLINDVGLHKGEDAAFYFKMGFKVLGIEANPELGQPCRARFRDEVANGTLRIIERAIAPASAGPTRRAARMVRYICQPVDDTPDSIVVTLPATRAGLDREC